MKKIVLMSLGLLLTSEAAMALPIYNTSIKYFDESGHLVGQRANACNGKTVHGGNVHTAFFIEEEILCGGAGGESPPTPNYIVPGTLITRYTLPGSLGIQQACTIAECADPTIPEIELLDDQGWTFSSGNG